MNIKEISQIDESFFEIDKDAKIAKIVLDFSNPDEIFDGEYITKTPLLCGYFTERLGNAFKLVSSRYKIDLTVRFDDLGEYSEEEMQEIFRKNFDLEFKSRFSENRKRNHIACNLIVIGLMFFMAMLLINNLWHSDSIWKEIFVYVSDIATTVTFWEAMTILVVEQKEKRDFLFDLRSRFSAIRFEKAERR